VEVLTTSRKIVQKPDKEIGDKDRTMSTSGETIKEGIITANLGRNRNNPFLSQNMKKSPLT
jgi:hypothetical protein